MDLISISKSQSKWNPVELYRNYKSNDNTVWLKTLVWNYLIEIIEFLRTMKMLLDFFKVLMNTNSVLPCSMFTL